MEAPKQATLHWADYVVFVAFLLGSAVIGFYFGWKAKKDAKLRTAENFLKGGGEMHYIPVSLSMMASFLSAIFVLSNPAEFYNYGTNYLFISIGYLVGNGIAAHLHLPLIYKLGVTSGYEYLEIRFNRAVRIAGSVTFSLMILLYMSVTLYLPALALSQVTDLNLEVAIVTVGVVVTFYTAVGGMKATVWNDAVQMTIVIIFFIVLIILGSIEVGGMGNVFRIAEEGDRLRFDKPDTWDPNPLLRMTFWNTVVGGTFINLTLYASSQTIIQKFISTKNIRDGQKAVWMSSVVTCINMVLVMLLGLVMYAYYVGCDPQTTGQVEKKDQLIPLYVMAVMGHLHGLPGLFLATTFSASLSSVSGSLNALAAVFLEDFFKPLHIFIKKYDMPVNVAAILSRCLALFFGVLTIGMSFAAKYFGDLVLQVAISVFGMVGAPLAGLLSVGMLVPCVNSIGAMAGLFVSLGLTSWIGIGAVVSRIPQPTLVMSTEDCIWPDSNLTTVMPDTGTTTAPEVTWLRIYEMSYMFYSVFAIFVVFIVSIPVSFITGYRKPQDADPRLQFSMADEWCPYCPIGCRRGCRCGVSHGDVANTVDDVNIKSEDVVEVKVSSLMTSRKVSDVTDEKHGIDNAGFSVTEWDSVVRSTRL